MTIAVPTSGGWTFQATLEEDEWHMLWLQTHVRPARSGTLPAHGRAQDRLAHRGEHAGGTGAARGARAREREAAVNVGLRSDFPGESRHSLSAACCRTVVLWMSRLVVGAHADDDARRAIDDVWRSGLAAGDISIWTAPAMLTFGLAVQ